MHHRMTHLCERCHHDTELFYCKSVDEYLCENCILELVRMLASEAEPDQPQEPS